LENYLDSLGDICWWG